MVLGEARSGEYPESQTDEYASVCSLYRACIRSLRYTHALGLSIGPNERRVFRVSEYVFSGGTYL